jgi:hypothetical protein
MLPPRPNLSPGNWGVTLYIAANISHTTRARGVAKSRLAGCRRRVAITRSMHQNIRARAVSEFRCARASTIKETLNLCLSKSRCCVSLALAENMLVLTSFIKSARAAIAVINKKL